MSALAVNKRVKFDYDLLEEYEGGIVLTGAETKSAKAGHINLKGAYVSLRGRELLLRGAFISHYKPAGSSDNYDPQRDRKILVKARELDRLYGKIKEAGLTLVPVRVYTKGRFVKLSFALARGKKKYEKREAIKKRETDRSIREHLKIARAHRTRG